MAKRNYAQNLVKEVKELRTARGAAKQAKINDIYDEGKSSLSSQNYYEKERSRTKKEAKSALGQLVGAALQGRRYTKSGKQITEKTTKNKSSSKEKTMPARKTAKYNSLNKTASGQSARSHQKDLAKISGKTAATSASKKAVEKQKKTSTKKPTLGYGIGLDKMVRIENKATKKTMGSFKKSK